MENSSLSYDNVTVDDADNDDDLSLYLVDIRHVAVKIIYITIGAVGIIDNMFVILIFALFINITDKVGWIGDLAIVHRTKYLA